MSVEKMSVLDADAKPRVRILVVEDEIFIRLTLSDRLREAEFDVVEAVNGDEALEILKAGVPFDLVLSDVRMPGSTDGLALLRFIKNYMGDVPVIITSGHLDNDTAFATGALNFLAKPFLTDEVVNIVKEEIKKIR